MMTEYLNKQEVIALIEEGLEILKATETENVRPNKPAKWLRVQRNAVEGLWDAADYRYCSNCGEIIAERWFGVKAFNFCPNCGADMRPEGKGE